MRKLVMPLLIIAVAGCQGVSRTDQAANAMILEIYKHAKIPPNTEWMVDYVMIYDADNTTYEYGVITATWRDVTHCYAVLTCKMHGDFVTLYIMRSGQYIYKSKIWHVMNCGG